MTTLALNIDDRDRRSNKGLALLITLIIHGAIFLFLLLYIIITPNPPYPETKTPEMILDFGGSSGGPGAHTANNTGTNSGAENAVNPATKAPSTNTPTVTNNVEPTTPIPSNTAKVQPKHIDTVPKPPQQPSIQLANAENKFKNAKGNPGGSTGQGGQGNNGGTSGGGQGPGSGLGSGPGVGNGKGFGYDLAGRQLIKRPELVNNNPQEGVIVVGITVDQDGNVTEATPGVKGTTITDGSLYILVKDAALKTKFNKSSTDSPEQNGTITFKFSIQ